MCEHQWQHNVMSLCNGRGAAEMLIDGGEGGIILVH